MEKIHQPKVTLREGQNEHLAGILKLTEQLQVLAEVQRMKAEYLLELMNELQVYIESD